MSCLLSVGCPLWLPTVIALLTPTLVGYKEYKTGREYMARMGDWREDKDWEIPLDGIGGVNILVKADVHRSGMIDAAHTHLLLVC